MISVQPRQGQTKFTINDMWISNAKQCIALYSSWKMIIKILLLSIGKCQLNLDYNLSSLFLKLSCMQRTSYIIVKLYAISTTESFCALWLLIAIIKPSSKDFTSNSLRPKSSSHLFRNKKNKNCSTLIV